MGFDEGYISGFGWEHETRKTRHKAEGRRQKLVKRIRAEDLRGFIWNLILARLSYEIIGYGV
jgi:hypothetical protein